MQLAPLVAGVIPATATPVAVAVLPVINVFIIPAADTVIVLASPKTIPVPAPLAKLPVADTTTLVPVTIVLLAMAALTLSVVTAAFDVKLVTETFTFRVVTAESIVNALITGDAKEAPLNVTVVPLALTVPPIVAFPL